MRKSVFSGKDELSFWYIKFVVLILIWGCATDSWVNHGYTSKCVGVISIGNSWNLGNCWDYSVKVYRMKEDKPEQNLRHTDIYGKCREVEACQGEEESRKEKSAE